ncbi:O-antigen ligase family protein [Mesobacillus harenae]|uniref:O-antigen ligase family protein n=1 Tax=Mesobacillus harenae TaxID=2213203 RepID=UPI00158008C3|nr:O-antigen ligase family protein [Mesobacillus harenae]
MKNRLKTPGVKSVFEIVILVIFAVYLSLIQFTTSYPYIHLLPIPTPAVLTLGMAFLFLVYCFLWRNNRSSYDADRLIKIFMLLFTLSILLSFLSAFYTQITINSTEYTAYLKKSMVTRMLYYGAFIAMVYFGYHSLSQIGRIKTLRTILAYPLSIFLMVAIGLWQLTYFLFGIPFLDIDTRSYVHSVSGITFFNFRLTSFADEPSYLGPIIIDMLVLGYLAFKRKWIYVLLLAIPSIVVLLFSFSVSAYLNLAILVAFIIVFLMFHPKFPKRYLWYLLAFTFAGIVIVVLAKPGLVASFFSPIIGRLDSLFNPEESSRIYMYVMPIFWLFDHSIISALFGYGPGSFEFLASSKILPNTGSVSTSSNNMYIDLLFENGLIGFSLIVLGLGILLLSLFKNARKNIYYFIALLELTHLLITSLYRADFVTPRFWGVLLIIFLLNRFGEMKEKGKNSRNGVDVIDG